MMAYIVTDLTYEPSSNRDETAERWHTAIGNLQEFSSEQRAKEVITVLRVSDSDGCRYTRPLYVCRAPVQA